jgi:hypothetical protein
MVDPQIHGIRGDGVALRVSRYWRRTAGREPRKAGTTRFVNRRQLPRSASRARRGTLTSTSSSQSGWTGDELCRVSKSRPSRRVESSELWPAPVPDISAPNTFGINEHDQRAARNRARAEVLFFASASSTSGVPAAGACGRMHDRVRIAAHGSSRCGDTCRRGSRWAAVVPSSESRGCQRRTRG